MPETGESPTPHLSGQYDADSQKLADERVKLELKERKLEQELSMGKYDVHPEGFTPPEGEMTYEQYLAQRPSEGVVRDELNGGYREAHTGRYASEEDYLAGKEVMPDEETADRTRLDDLGLVALAKEFAEAKQRNDIADKKEIEEAVRSRIEKQAYNEKSGNLTVADVEKAVEQEMRVFYDRAERLGADRSPSDTDQSSEVGDFVTIKTGNGDEGITENISEQQFGEEFDTLTSPFKSGRFANKEPNKESGVDSEGSADETEAPKKYTFGGVEVEVGEEYEAPDGSEMVSIIFNGDKVFVSKKLLIEAEAEPDSGQEDDEIEQEEAENDQEDGENERQSSWWSRNKKFFGINYYAAQWTMMLQRSRERGQITDEMTQEEINEVLERKRRNQVLGMVTVAVATGLATYLAIKGNGVHHDAVASGGVTPDTMHDVTPGITDHLPSVDTAGDVPPSIDISVEPLNPSYEIPSGTGGEALFQRLGLEPRSWYRHQDDLLNRFPGSFYRMDSGNVGIAQSGWLPNEVQSYIESLR